ncbi:MFS transporter [Halomonas sp. V046]|uniref:MFS transporter n=1 Tax=Halomonas sp. V046 TaxID=3459611 RepID=UPI004044E335
MTTPCTSQAMAEAPVSRGYPAPSTATRKTWLGLAVLALPTMLLGLDVTILYLALPALAMDLQPSATQALWIMDVYGFMIAGFLITMGTLGDRIGRRRLLMMGMLAFGATSIMAAYATSADMLLIARALLGIAGATLMPSTLSLITNLFANAHQRALAIGIWATSFALGMAAGPVLGGWLLNQFWWGAPFLIAVPITGLLLVTAPLLLPEYRSHHAGRLDLVSVLLSLGAVLPTVYGLKAMAKVGPAVMPALAIGLGIAMAIVFIRRQRRLPQPLIDLSLFDSRTFRVALLVLMLGLIAVAGMMLLVTQYLQLVAGLTPLRAGLWMGLPALMMVAAGVISPLVARRIRPGYVVAGVLLLSTLGYLLLALVDTSPSALWWAVAGFSLVYMGLGTLAALGTELVIGTAPVAKAGAASALSEMVQELGVALGIALMGSLATLIYRQQIAADIPGDLCAQHASAIEQGLWKTATLAHELPTTLVTASQQSFAAGLNVAAAVSGALVLMLALLATIYLRDVPALGEEALGKEALGKETLGEE